MGYRMAFRKEALLLSVISIVFLAGCTTQPSGPAVAGVIIKSFAPETQEVQGSDQVSFIFLLENTGERMARDVKGELFGLSTEWECVGGRCHDGPWNLLGADATNNFKGDDIQGEVVMGTPPSKSSDITYDASLRVSYGYTTVSESLVRFVTSDYIRVNPSEQRGIVSSTTTSGPLFVNVKALSPVLSADNSMGRVQFEIQNIGGGRVYINDPNTAGNLDKVQTITISTSGSGINLKTCRSQTAVNNQIVFNDAPNPRLRLANGKSALITCDIAIDKTQLKNFKDIPITLAADYGYFVDSTTEVKVLKAFS